MHSARILQNCVTMRATPTDSIDADDRTGVLAPSNLARFDARWIAPDPRVRDVIDTYWTVTWALAEGDGIRQRIIDHPSVTFSIEEGDVAAPLVVSATRATAWSRVIAGTGTVFAMRLRPAGLAVLSDLDPGRLRGEHPLTPELDPRAHAALAEIAAGGPGAADAVVARLLAERPPSDQHLLANAAVDLLTAEPRVRAGAEVAAALHVGERTLQRALRATIGRGPAEVARRIRLQEVVRRLTQGDAVAAIAGDLGYVDQAHLANEFRRTAGVTPGQYGRELRATA